MFSTRSLLPLLLVALSIGCAPAPKGPPAQPDLAGPDASDGAALYRAYCASCHRPLAETGQPNRTVSRIHSSIRQFGAMRHLDLLPIVQLQTLAEVLKRS